jgi:Fe-S-cluster containining protein
MEDRESERFNAEQATGTDEEIEAAIDKANSEGKSFGIPIAATSETIAWFLNTAFACERCGRCCRGEFDSARGDAVFIHDEEIGRIANYLKCGARRVKKLCISNSQGTWSLPYPCHFLAGVQLPVCSVYPVRPQTCRHYPLYSIVEAQDVWEQKLRDPYLSIDAECPGAKRAAMQILRGELTPDATA